MIETLEVRQLEQIAEDATELCNVPFTLLSVLNEKTDKFEFKVLGGLTNPLLQSALRVGREAIGIEFLGFSHATDVNRFIRGIMQNKRFAFTDIYTAAENILARPAIDAIQLILRIEMLAVFPIIIKDQIKGLFGFISQRELNDKDLRLMQIFVNQTRLLIENILLNTDLEGQVKARTAELQGAVDSLSLLSRTAEDFLALPTEADIFKYIAGQVQQIVGKEVIVGIGEYVEKEDRIYARELLGLNPYLENISKLLGADPRAISYRGDEESRAILLKGKLTDITQGLSMISKDIPGPVIAAITKLLNVSKFYAIGFSWQGKIYGDVLIVLRNDQVLKNAPLVEAFVKQAGMALQHRQAEKDLREARDRFATLVNALPEAVATTDLNGAMTFVSESNLGLLGYRSAAEILGKNAFELIAPDQREKARKNMETISQTRKTTREKFDIVKADGSTFPAELTAAPILDLAGKISGFIAIIRKLEG